MKEDNFINLIKSLLVSSTDYIGDDTAYIAEKDLILTQDTLIEDVHFRQSTISPFDLGIKSIATNLSDIAASGGIPKFVLISLSLPENIDKIFIEEFYKGVNSICAEYNVLVIGGDLTGASQIAVSITAIGYGENIIPSKRCYAKPDEIIIATGVFGSSRVGLWLLEEKKEGRETNNILPDIADKFIKAHINPVPKLKEGREIIKTSNKQTALMDTSDGLADALYKISKQSNVSMEIEYENIPVDKDFNFIAKTININPFNWVFYGGEDYELVGCVSEECYNDLKSKNIQVSKIGKVISAENKPEVYVRYKNQNIKIDSNSIDNELFSHFK